MATCALVLVSACLFVASESGNYGDGSVYAADIRAGALIEPGHMLWRPLGHLIGVVLRQQPTSSNILWQLQFLCLGASVLAVAAMYIIASRMYGSSVGFLAAMLMMVSNGFWSYSFSGCAYTLSVLFTTIALGFAISAGGATIAPFGALSAGIFGGLAGATWAVQLLAAPALWLALMLTPGRDRISPMSQLKNTALLVAGYALAFVIPLLLAYAVHLGYARGLDAGRSGNVGLIAWLSSSDHGVAGHYSVAQALRVAMGWPQSVISASDIGEKLRLWYTREAGFPVSAWLGVFVVVFGALAAGIRALVKGYARLDNRDRGVVVACVAAITTNLLFAAAWKGTDLERYLPSWPFQLLLIALITKWITDRLSSRYIVIVGVAIITSVAIINWYGTFEPILAPDSYRQAWLQALRQQTSASDLVILFGQRTRVVESPHDPNMPRIDRVSNDIITHGDKWRLVVLGNIAQTKRRGGRVFLADSLFGTTSTPRDGWSFKERPTPSPSELESVFLPFKSDRIAFVIRGERVWIGK